MRPITVTCRATLALSPADIAAQILDLSRWPEFAGFGPIPGVRSAEFEVRTPEVVGTRIRVVNTDGSAHIEEVAEWQPDTRLTLHMTAFSPPLSRLATGFVETWAFVRIDNATSVTRSFELHPKTAWTRPVLWLIALLLRRAVARHLRQMRDLEQSRTSNPPA